MTFRMIVQLWNTNTSAFVSCDADLTENYMYISMKFGTGVHVFCWEVGVFNRSFFQSVSYKWLKLSLILHEYMHCMCAHSMQWKWLKLDHLILATPVAAKSDTLACTSPIVIFRNLSFLMNWEEFSQNAMIFGKITRIKILKHDVCMKQYPWWKNH